MAERVHVREISNVEGNRLLQIVRRSSGSVMTWRRAQMVLLSAQGMDVAKIAQVTFTSPDRVRDVIHNFNADGFDSLRPKYGGGRPPKFDPDQRAAIKQIALARPGDHGLPFSTWSLSKLADYLVAQGVVEDISTHEGLRVLLSVHLDQAFRTPRRGGDRGLRRGGRHELRQRVGRDDQRLVQDRADQTPRPLAQQRRRRVRHRRMGRWYNHRRLYEYCGDMPPADLEALYYDSHQALQPAELTTT